MYRRVKRGVRGGRKAYPLTCELFISSFDFSETRFTGPSSPGGEFYIDPSIVKGGVMEFESLLQGISVGKFEKGTSFGFGSRCT